jgi:hypothetical protein
MDIPGETSRTIGYIFWSLIMNVKQLRVGMTSAFQLGYNDAVHGLDFSPPGFSEGNDTEYRLGYDEGSGSITEFGFLDDDEIY